ncbi:MAG TPA: NUDIX domain-containing protein, partial [Kiloniellales bacterium]|nr:NUDIX domain-containing protein [Kiloniellales bacterium]
TEWRDMAWTRRQTLAQAPLDTEWQALPGLVRHTFTHFHLELSVWAGRCPSGARLPGRWVRLDELGAQALPTVMRKAIRHALSAEPVAGSAGGPGRR